MTAASENVSRGRIPWLDGWRGLSILLVLFGHFVWESPLGLSSVGVELFFVLSGRLMAEILFAERFALPAFFQRRLSRIYPGLVAFVLLAWAGCAHSSLAFKPAAVASALTFTLNYAIVLRHGVAAIENLWSLCVEEHAYVLLGLLVFAARRGRFDPAWAVLGLALASMADALVCTLLLGQSDIRAHWRTDAHVGSILVAVAVFLRLRGRRVAAWIPAALLPAAIAAAAGPPALKFVLTPVLASFAVCTLHAAPAALRAGLSWRPLRIAGAWSYSIYLWQQPFSRLALEGRLSNWQALGLGVLCGAASFYLVEQPARRWLNARWDARAARAGPAAVDGSPA